MSSWAREPDLENRRLEKPAKTCLGKGRSSETKDWEGKLFGRLSRVWGEDVETPEITLSRKANVFRYREEIW